jgi:hypothetical protein
MQQGCSKRCTECRACFRTASSAQKTQKVCSPWCRRRRRRRLARQRRSRRVQDYRVDERERQRRCRARRRGSGAGPPGCHAPASASKSADLLEKVLESWDRAVAMSRASLERRMLAILRDLATNSGSGEAVTAGLLRAGLGPLGLRSAVADEHPPAAVPAATYVGPLLHKLLHKLSGRQVRDRPVPMDEARKPQ